jgi:hypothetical protein
VQYDLELDPRIDDAHFQSSAFPEASKPVAAIAKRLGPASHFKLFSYAARNDMCPSEHRETEIPWFDPQVGIVAVPRPPRHGDREQNCLISVRRPGYRGGRVD